jgi:hypothetical protein
VAIGDDVHTNNKEQKMTDDTKDGDAENIFSFEPALNADVALDDDELIRRAEAKISEWQDAGEPSLQAVQELFHESICASAGSMARDKIIAAIIAVWGTELGGKRAMISDWNRLAKEYAEARAQDARENTAQQELTPAQKAQLRTALWDNVSELAQSLDLMDRIVKQVQNLGVVNERELIVLTYIAATSRVLEYPINIIIKGVSSGGKSFTVLHTLELFDQAFINKLTSSSALSLVYDTRPLAHTVMLLFEAVQMQEQKADTDSTFAMLVRTLISEGQIIHQTTVEDPESPTGRRVERIERKGPIALISTTTGELYSENETRMLTWHIHENREQTAAVMAGLATRVIGDAAASADLAVWHDLQRWIGLGPNDAVIPFAQQITDGIPPLMVRFRRDVGSLFSFIKASAILHQAQRQIDSKGRVVATVDDYAVAYPIFSRVMAESAGKAVTDNVRTVVELISKRAGAAPTGTGMRFKRVEVAGRPSEVIISSSEIGTALGIGKSAAYRAVHTAIDLGYLSNNEIRQSKPFKLVLKHGVDEVGTSLLPDPRTIAREGGTA